MGAKSRSRPPKELPPCDGPKLSLFPHWNSPIEWLGRLDSHLPDHSESGKQGYVFKVRIKSQIYALKVFKFFNPDDDVDSWHDIVEGPNARRQVELQTDPFYAECRAYGRINEATKNGKVKNDISIPCFGFLYIDEKYLPTLLESGVDLEEDCLLSEGCISAASESTTPPLHRIRDPTKAPIRGIVKELASSSSGVNYRSIERIRKDILALNRLQVYNRDVRKDNFLDGKLVDFGSAWTEPHYGMGPLNAEDADDTKVGDLVMLERIATDEGYIVSWRMFRNVDYTKKLRKKRVK